MKILELFENVKPKAKSIKDLLGSVVNGEFTKNGEKLKVSSWFNCADLELTSLNGLPFSVSGGFNCSGNKLTSLDGVPSAILSGGFSCGHNKLTSLHNIHKLIKDIMWHADFSKNPIKSHVLGLLKIENLANVELDNKKVENIINKYLPEGDIVECQQELIEAGLDDFAQL